MCVLRPYHSKSILNQMKQVNVGRGADRVCGLNRNWVARICLNHQSSSRVQRTPINSYCCFMVSAHPPTIWFLWDRRPRSAVRKPQWSASRNLTFPRRDEDDDSAPRRFPVRKISTQRSYQWVILAPRLSTSPAGVNTTTSPAWRCFPCTTTSWPIMH